MARDERQVHVIGPSLEDTVLSFIEGQLQAANGTERFKELREKFEALDASLDGKIENSKAGRNGFFNRIEHRHAALRELVSYIITVDRVLLP